MRGKKIVLDLEFIPYRRKQEPYCVHEIIEIGAVALDADNEIYDEFQMYVKPQYGTVPPFVTAITGITNEMLVGQVSFSEAMQAFATGGLLPLLYLEWQRPACFSGRS